MIIGLTGGIGSGKSTIAQQLRTMGYAVYDTDSQAKRIIVKDAAVRQQIEHLFGNEVYADGVYQTALVAQRVFTDKSLLAQLNDIVHPAVKDDILRWATGLKSTSSGEEICFVECAILYQAGFDTLCDKVVAVAASEEVRLARVIARDKSNIEKVRARMRMQDANQDLKRADIVIHNDGHTDIPTLCHMLLNQLLANPNQHSRTI